MKAKKATRKNPVAEPLNKYVQEEIECTILPAKPYEDVYLKRLLTPEEAAERENLPLNVYKKLLKQDTTKGQLLFVSCETFEFIQTNNAVEGLNDAFFSFGDKILIMNLHHPDGIDRHGWGLFSWELK